MADGGSRHTNEQREASKSQESDARKSGQRAGNFLESSCKQTQFSSHTHHKHTYLQSARIRKIGTQDTKIFLHFLPLLLFFIPPAPLFFYLCFVTTYFFSFDVPSRDIAFHDKLLRLNVDHSTVQLVIRTKGRVHFIAKYFEHIWWNHFPLRFFLRPEKGICICEFFF